MVDLASGTGVLGTGVTGVHGVGFAGPGVLAEGNGPTGTALQVQNGAIKVPAASASPVFQVVMGPGCNDFSHPLTDGDPTAILFVTPTGIDRPAVSVLFDVSNSRWALCTSSASTHTYNVLVIKR